MNKKRSLVLLVVVLVGLVVVGWEVVGLAKGTEFSGVVVVWDSDLTTDFYYRFDNTNNVWQYRVFDKGENNYKCGYTPVGSACGDFDPVTDPMDVYAKLDKELTSKPTFEGGAAVLCEYTKNNGWELWVGTTKVEISDCEASLVKLASREKEAGKPEEEKEIPVLLKTIPILAPIDEVWLRIGKALEIEEALGENVWEPAEGWVVYALPAPTVAEGVVAGRQMETDLKVGRYDQAFVDKVNQISGELGINPMHLMAVMSFETAGTFSPSIRNPKSKAVGLIQFVESTAEGLGTTTAKLAQMSQIEQLDYVKKYFEQYKNRIRPGNFGDVAMAVFYPERGLGKEDDVVLFSKASWPKAYTQNEKLDTNKDEEITRGEYVQPALERLKGYTK